MDDMIVKDSAVPPNQSPASKALRNEGEVLFGRFSATKKPKRWGLLPWLSLGAHCLGASLLVLAGLWEIEELGRPHRGLAIAHSFSSAAGGGGNEAPENKVEKLKPKKKAIKEDRQPSEKANEEVTSASSATSEADGNDSDGIGVGTGKGDQTGPGTGKGGSSIVGTDLCIVDCGLELPPPAAKEEPVYLPATVLGKLQRVAGEIDIQAPSSTHQEMLRTNTKRLSAVIQMCLDRQGSVSKQKILKSSGSLAYDSKLRNAVRRWRYKPFQANGKAVPMCTQVTFVYTP